MVDAPRDPQTPRRARFSGATKDTHGRIWRWSGWNELFILSVIAFCMGLSLYAYAPTSTQAIWMPALFGGASVILLRIGYRCATSASWSRAVGGAGLALLTLDLGGCTIHRGAAYIFWAPLLALALVGAGAWAFRRASRPSSRVPASGSCAPLAASIRRLRRPVDTCDTESLSVSRREPDKTPPGTSASRS